MAREFHPVANIFPMLGASELRGLAEDIRANGLRVPIVLHPDGRILDGRNRALACDQAEVEPTYEKWSGDGDAVKYVVSLNLLRRHLDESQRCQVAGRIANLGEGRPKETASIEAVSVQPPISQAKAAELMNVSRSGVQRAVKVLHHGTPELIAAVDAGEVAVSVAAEIASVPVAEQKEIVARGEAEIIRAARKIKSEKSKAARIGRFERAVQVAKSLPPATDRFRVFEADILSGLDGVEDESVDLIITDPPYPAEYLPLFSALSAVAARVLKPGGSRVAMVGQSYLPEVIQRLSESLDYEWCAAYLTPGAGSPQLWRKRVSTYWKPLLWFVRGEYEGQYVGDVCKSDADARTKELHVWGQTESGMADILAKFALPGQVVFDPFLGAGTTGVAALSRGCHFIGCDIDKSIVATALTRLHEAANAA